LDAVFMRALARAPGEAERQSLRAFFARQTERFRAEPESAAECLRGGVWRAPEGIDPVVAAAWTQVARVILNLHETVTRY
jgi:hypothetical protein